MQEALKELVKEAVREVLLEGAGPLMTIDAVAQMLGLRDPRSARKALAERGIPVERVGTKWVVNREHLAVIGTMRRGDARVD